MASAETSVVFEWRGSFTNGEVNALHAEAFETRVRRIRVELARAHRARHSLGWITARRGEKLVGFANVLWGWTRAWNVCGSSTSTNAGSAPSTAD